MRTAPLREAGVLCRAQLIEDPDAIGVLRRVAREVLQQMQAELQRLLQQTGYERTRP